MLRATAAETARVDRGMIVHELWLSSNLKASARRSMSLGRGVTPWHMFHCGVSRLKGGMIRIVPKPEVAASQGAEAPRKDCTRCSVGSELGGPV